MQARHILTASERSRLLPFVVASGEISPRDQRDLMERPFFSLSKTKRTTPILYAVGDTRVEVFGMPEHGMATIWDADVLIWAASQIVEAENLGLTTSRFLRFTPYQLLTGIGRQTGARDYGCSGRHLPGSSPPWSPPRSATARTGDGSSFPGLPSGKSAPAGTVAPLVSRSSFRNGSIVA